MNALMNITVRVQSAQAQREVEALQAEIKALQAQMATASTVANRLIPNSAMAGLARWGSQMQWAGRQLMTNFTYPVAASGTLLTKWYLDNEAGATRLAKVYGDLGQSANSYSNDAAQLAQVMDLLSEKFGVQRAQVLDIAGDWAAAGAQGEALANGVQATLTTMVLGEMESAKATEALIAIQAQYGASTEQLVGIVEKLNATENATGVTFSGLVEGMARSAGAARSAGIDVDHLAAMIAALSPAAGTAANAGNAIKTMVSRILAPTGSAAEVMELMGIKIDEASWKSLNGSERVEALAKAFHELEGATEDTVSAQAAYVSAEVASRWNINRFDVLMRDVYNSMHAAGDANGYYGKTLEILAQEALVVKAAQDELNTVLESEPVAVKRAGVAIQNDLMKVIAMLMPQIMWLIHSVQELVSQFTNLDPALQKGILAFVALLAVIGPPLSIMGALAVAVGRLGQVFGSIGGAFKSFIGFLGFTSTQATNASVASVNATKSIATSSGGISAALSGAAGGVKTAVASMILDFQSAAKAYQISVAEMQAASLAQDRMNARRAAGSFAATAIEEANAVRSARAAMASRAKIASVALSVSAAHASVAGAATRAATGISTGWTRISTATRAGADRTIAHASRLATVLPGTILAGTERAAGTWMKFTNLTLPGAMESGMTAVNMTVARSGLAMNAIMSRSLMENLAVLNSYVNSVTAMGARGAAQVSAATAAAGTALAGGSRTMRTAGATAGASFMASMLTSIRGVIPKVLAFFKGMGPKLASAARAFGPLIGRALASVGRFMLGPFGLAISAVLGLLMIFEKQIGQIFSNVAAQFQDSTTPFGQAWQGVVSLFYKGVELVHKAFRALPEGMQGSLRAAVDLVRQAALAVYSWFSYFNPFQRHSPSLVENVTNGMRVVGDQFGLASRRIGGYAMEAYGHLQRWGTATANFMTRYNAFLVSEDRATIAKHIPGAVNEYNALTASLVPLKANLDAVSAAMDSQQVIVDRLAIKLKAAQDRAAAMQTTFDSLQRTADALGSSLDAAQASLDYYASAPIAGMREMSDAMFENEMRQKELQLALMDWEDVNGSVDDITSRMANLQGEIEALRGTANDLRSAGAGSDILGPINSQIAAMEAAYAAMGNGMANSPVDEMQSELERLKREAERLDLENSLKFDPLTREIERAAQAYKELPFNEIVDGVTRQRAAVDALQKKYDEATAAVDKQQAALDAANAQVDLAQSAYDAQAASLENLTSVYDSLNEEITTIEESIRSVVDAANAMEQALAAASSAGGSGGFGGGGGGGGLGPAGEGFLGAAGGAYADVGDAFTIGDEAAGSLDKWLDDFMKENASLFEEFDMFGGIKASWNKFTGWWGTNVTPIFSNLGKGIVEIFTGIDWSPIQGAWSSLTDLFGPQVKEIWDTVKGAISNAVGDISAQFERFGPVIGPAKDAVSNIGDVLMWLWNNVLKPVGAFIGGAFVSMFSVAFSIIGNIVGPAIDFIGDLIGSIIQIIRGVINIVVGIFTGDWKRAWDGAIEVVSGAWTAIWSLIENTGKTIWGIVSGIVEGIVDFFTWLYDILVGHSIVPDLVNAIIQWFTSLYNDGIAWISNLVNSAIEWFTTMGVKVVTEVSTFIAKVITFFKELPGKAGEAIGDVTRTLVDKGRALVNGFKVGAEIIWNNVTEWLGGRASAAGRALGDVSRSLLEKGKGIVNGFWNGAKDIFNQVNGWFGGRPGALVSALGNLGGILWNAGSNIMSGFFNGLKSKWDDIKSWVGGIGPWIADHKGPKAYDLALLRPAGGWIMEGLGDGLGAGFENVRKQVSNMAPALASTMSAGLSASMGQAVSAANRLTAAGVTIANPVTQYNETVVNNFYGDMNFPGITSGDEAGKFIQNLSDLAGES